MFFSRKLKGWNDMPRAHIERQGDGLTVCVRGREYNEVHFYQRGPKIYRRGPAGGSVEVPIEHGQGLRDVAAAYASKVTGHNYVSR